MSNQTQTNSLDGPMPLPDDGSVAKRREIQAVLIHHVAELNEQAVLALVQERLSDGDDPLSIVEDCQEGMRRVGEHYEQRRYYLSGLIMAGEIFREVMELAQPVIEAQISGEKSGRVLLGTVQGDIHDIGKNIQGMLLSCHGFTVYDLGVDVPPAEFLAQAKKVKPDIIGLSGLLTSSYDVMRDTITLIRDTTVPELADLPIIIGGTSINEQVCQYVGADHWVVNSMEGVRLCQRLLAGKAQ
jgi:methanogenic corrinoid protein MtbC1